MQTPKFNKNFVCVYVLVSFYCLLDTAWEKEASAEELSRSD